MILTGTYLPLKGDEPKDPEYDIFSDHPVGKIYKLEHEQDWNEFQMDSAFTALGRKQVADNFRNHFFESLEVMLIQVSRFWFNMPFFIRPNPGTGTILAAVYKFVLTVFMFAGLFIMVYKKKDRFSQICIFFMLIYTSLHSIVFSSLRYSAPLVPLLIIFSSIGIIALYNRYKNKNRETPEIL
jgi:hypothetical protein